MSPSSEEGDKDRRDRELMELLGELRVALPGVQVLFAFLLTVPFSQRFASVTTTQRNVFFAAFLCAAAASAFLIAPSAFHRIQWREGDKERLLAISNALTIVGIVLLALAIGCVVFVITDVVFDGPLVPIVTAVNGLLFGLLWFVLPVYRHLRT